MPEAKPLLHFSLFFFCLFIPPLAIPYLSHHLSRIILIDRIYQRSVPRRGAILLSREYRGYFQVNDGSLLYQANILQI